GGILHVQLSSATSKGIELRSLTPGAKLVNAELQIPLPAVEVGIPHGLPNPGAVTAQMKVLDQEASSRSLRLQLSAPANSRQTLFLRINDPKIKLKIEGAEIAAGSNQLAIEFPAGAGYVEKTVTASW
ncbi:MAG TPA: hypothetical protein VL983_05630, partial [Terriglobales bacterium]|nr:hypothetical protein [Terriglobales bacterium]